MFPRRRVYGPGWRWRRWRRPIYWRRRRPGCWWLLTLLLGGFAVCGLLSLALFRVPFWLLR